jgi:ubiquinone/menaquinone biosynthesis C-methylase UbiE
VSEQLAFDERMAAQLDVFYRSRDVMRRRALVADALGARPGDDVLDVGCGPGYYVLDALDRVGEAGTVTGVEPSPAMFAVATRRIEGRPNARVVEGHAAELPAEDGSFDRALSTQVFEYLDASTVDQALAELTRVLRPGGRLVLWDIDWSTVSWHSSDDARMARALKGWDRHLAQPTLPRTLQATLRRAGFTDVSREPHVFACTAMDPETYGGTLPILIRQFLEALHDVDQDEVTAWFEDQQELDERGEYSFAIVQFCFTATRP